MDVYESLFLLSFLYHCSHISVTLYRVQQFLVLAFFHLPLTGHRISQQSLSVVPLINISLSLFACSDSIL